MIKYQTPLQYLFQAIQTIQVLLRVGLTKTLLVARVLVAPSEFPIGIITAFIGAPVFLYMLISNSRKQQKRGFYA
jgi:ABC-type Fe3+-siderophore transport system permease subunit